MSEADGTKKGDKPAVSAGLLVRASVGGAMMGLANLVPGISGGTMLVAVGIYRAFIDAISDATRLRLSVRVVVLLGTVVLSAMIAIGGLAGVIAWSLAEFRWGMYSLFIGLTLGGAPLLARMLRPIRAGAWIGIVGGIAAMLGLVLLQGSGANAGPSGDNAVLLGLGGAAGASAMILPGVSGAYLLLLLGQYEAIIGAIKDFMRAGIDRDPSAMLAQFGVLVPVGVGVVLGIVLVSNLLRYLLHRFEKATLGVLLGLLLAAPAGLWPFERGIEPRAGEVFEGEVLTAESAAEIDPKDWATERYTPGGGQVLGSVGLIGLGFGLTMGVALLGRSKKAHEDEGEGEGDQGD
ncbi:MAG: DUF368 domain-containing protein [Planctomycetota bacterium]